MPFDLPFKAHVKREKRKEERKREGKEKEVDPECGPEHQKTTFLPLPLFPFLLFPLLIYLDLFLRRILCPPNFLWLLVLCPTTSRECAIGFLPQHPGHSFSFPFTLQQCPPDSRPDDALVHTPCYFLVPQEF